VLAANQEITVVGSFTIRNSLYRGLPMLLVPPVILIAIIYSGNFYFLEYFHVVSGSAWTGMDLVMGLFFSFIMAGLPNDQKLEVSRRLTPTMLFFMPSISTTAVTAGIYLALAMHISFASPYFIAVAVLALVLTVQGLVIFLPNELRVYLEILGGSKDRSKIVRLTMLNIRISAIQLVLQIVIILFMAHFATGVPL
jgi:hypothetical protein